jgi:hypothetical protein
LVRHVLSSAVFVTVNLRLVGKVCHWMMSLSDIRLSE